MFRLRFFKFLKVRLAEIVQILFHFFGRLARITSKRVQIEYAVLGGHDVILHNACEYVGVERIGQAAHERHILIVDRVGLELLLGGIGRLAVVFLVGRGERAIDQSHAVLVEMQRDFGGCHRAILLVLEADQVLDEVVDATLAFEAVCFSETQIPAVK